MAERYSVILGKAQPANEIISKRRSPIQNCRLENEWCCQFQLQSSFSSKFRIEVGRSLKLIGLGEFKSDMLSTNARAMSRVSCEQMFIKYVVLKRQAVFAATLGVCGLCSFLP